MIVGLSAALNIPLEERAAHGVAFLDAYRPGWAQDVNLARLNLWMGDSCILGQLFGSYSAALFELKQDTVWAVIHGFLSTECTRLQGMWVKAIQARVEENPT